MLWGRELGLFLDNCFPEEIRQLTVGPTEACQQKPITQWVYWGKIMGNPLIHLCGSLCHMEDQQAFRECCISRIAAGYNEDDMARMK